MPGILKEVQHRLDQLNRTIGQAVSWLNLVLVLLVCFDVITRYFFNDTKAWIMELEWHIFALIFLLGAGYALQADRHVRVDLFYQRFAPRDQALVNFIGTLLFLLPWSGLLGYFSFYYAQGAFLIRETSPDPGGLPARYLIKFAILFGFALLWLQGISLLIKSWQELRSRGAEVNDESDSHQNEEAWK
jgi:TRAP-type mannitol/chloroaromatic compound transport system permease small subunit